VIEAFIHCTSTMTVSVLLPSELLALHVNEPASWRLTLESVSRGPLATTSFHVRLPDDQLYEMFAGLATAVTLTTTAGWCSNTETVYGDVDVVNTGLSDAAHAHNSVTNYRTSMH